MIDLEFFAGANTRYGFKSIFDECLKNTKRVFILKGSSGCGKSTFMRRIAGKAAVLKTEHDIIRCSADPDSLDGVILRDLDVAVIDGTAPHVTDVRYPCVRESIINLGQFWNDEKLLPHRDKIIELTDRKSRHYETAYNYLSAAGRIFDIKARLIAGALLREKTDGFVFRFSEKIMGDTKGERNTVFATAFTSNGINTLSVFGQIDTVYRVKGVASDRLMSALEQIALEKGVAHTVSHSPIDPAIPDMLYFPETKTAVTSLDAPIAKKYNEEKIISTARFTDNNALSGMRAGLRTLEKLINELSAEARTELDYAKTVHNEIEKIYIPAMDFGLLDEYTFNFTDKLFSE